MLVSGVSVVCVDVIDFKLSVSVVSVVCIDVIVILSLSVSVSVRGVWKVAARWMKVESGEGRSGLEVIGALLIG